MQETANRLIHIGQPIEFDEKKFYEKLEELKAESKEEKADVREWVKELVPTYNYKPNADNDRSDGDDREYVIPGKHEQRG